MRVLHVVDSLEFGGLERVVAELAIAQRRAGIDSAVFSLQSTEGLAPQLRQAGVPVVIGAKRATADLALLRRLRATVSERRIGVVHAHSFVPNYYAAAATRWLRAAPAIVGTCHDMGQRLGNRRLRWLYRWSLRHTAAVAMVGQQVSDRFVGAGLVPAAKARVVRNGTPTERHAATPARRAAARAALGAGDGDLLIGAVGRLVPLKNHQLLIEQMPQLLAAFPAVRLAIVGGGPLAEPLAALVAQLGLEGQVKLLGPRDDAADLMAGFDLFALPSLTEGLSIALLEAAAAGLPIVATAVGGNPEVVQDGDRGLLVPAADGAALRAAIARLLGDRALRASLGARACAWVGRHASMDSVVAAYRQLYEQAMTGRPPGRTGGL